MHNFLGGDLLAIGADIAAFGEGQLWSALHLELLQLMHSSHCLSLPILLKQEQ